MDRCETCKWWDTSTVQRDADAEEEYSPCRRRAPTQTDFRTGFAAWPFVAEDDWCGEWEAEKKEPPAEAEGSSQTGGESVQPAFELRVCPVCEANRYGECSRTDCGLA